MTTSSLSSTNLKPQSSEPQYCGELDENDLRFGQGCQKWKTETSTQNYTGTFQFNNLHGQGTYFIDKQNDQSYYDGSFYVNQLEGYNKVFYPDGSYFEGLFKENTRFGPGVHTNPDRTQDVGFWKGFNLRRLISSEEGIPSLVTTSKVKLAKFREIVNVNQANERFEQIELYNVNIRNPAGLFFDKSLYKEEDVEESSSIERYLQEMYSQTESDPLDNIDLTCCCYLGHQDKFTQLCVQLYNIELRLSQITEQLQFTENQIKTCKDCCAKIVHQQMLLKKKLDNKATVERITSEIKNLIASLFSTEKLSHLTKSEVEIRNYLYTHSDIFQKTPPEHVSVHDFSVLSKIDFEKFASSLFPLCNSRIAEEEFGEFDFIDSEIPEWQCVCGNFLSDNLNTLEEKLQQLKQEQVFFGAIKTNLQSHLDREFEGRITGRVPKIKSLRSWNNEEIWIEMLQHCFWNIPSERNVTLKVTNIFSGDRESFKDQGSYEKSGKEFLGACQEGDKRVILNYIATRNVHPDLCDFCGNTGLMIASINDKLDVIKTLVNCGATLDTINDECLTPLAMSFLRYISVKFSVTDWEQAFLQESTTDMVQEWRPLNSRPVSNCQPQEQKYLFSLEFPVEVKPKKKHSHKVEEKVQEIDQEKLQLIEETIVTLLELGSDPSLSKVPLDPLFLAIFSDNSVFLKHLLENGADVNCKLSNGNLTSLHVLASLKITPERVKMFEILLGAQADPNIRTDSDHWLEVSSELIGRKSDDGKNVLHMMCLREDFDEENCEMFARICTMLIWKGCRNEDYYLGLTPLSLAVIRGNVKVIEGLLQTRRVDPHFLLGNEMGNVLTVLTINRNLSLENKKIVVQTLLQNNCNPLQSIGRYENVVAFLQKDLTKPKKKKKKKSKKSKTNSSTTRKSKKSKRRRKKIKPESLEDYLRRNAKECLLRHIQGKVMFCLYILMEETLIADPLVSNLTKFVAPDEALQILQLLFQNNLLDLHDFNNNVIYDLVEFLLVNNNLEKELSDLKTILTQNIENMSWRTITIDPYDLYLPPPEVDTDEEKYKICFNCLLKKDKYLQKCPTCEVVFFCSLKCNLESGRRRDHHCPIFYNEKLPKSDDGPNRLEILLEMARKMKNERLAFHELKKEEAKFSSSGLHSKKEIQKVEALQANVHQLQKEKEKFAVLNNLWDPRLTFINNEDNANLDEVNSSLKIKLFTISAMALNKLTEKKSNKSVSKIQETSKMNEKLQSELTYTSKSTKANNLRKARRSSGLSYNELFLQFLANRSQMETLKGENQKTKSFMDKGRCMELLTKVFVDFNLPLLLLPYACYKDGQVYYSMTGKNVVPEAGFNKFQIRN